MHPAVVAVVLAAAYDPEIDQALDPQRGLALGFALERFPDDFGVTIRLASPWGWDGRLAVAVVGGVAWFEDLRALPDGSEPGGFGSRSVFGRVRLQGELALPLALAAGRLYVAAGPSLLWLPVRLSTTRVSPGAYAAVGVELFAGDGYRTYPIAFYLEIGATAHTASQDVASRVEPVDVDPQVDRPERLDRAIGTGVTFHGGLRFYLWR